MSSALAIAATPQPLYRSISRTHLGTVRQINEDRVLDRSDCGLWAVADGMGGHRGGDIAAEIAIAALRSLADSPTVLDIGAIRAALEAANAEIYQRGQSAGGVIGSTIVVLHIADATATLFWAGDSRAYRFAHAGCEQLTIDHSLVQQLVDAGLIAPQQAARHPQAHVITRALGVDATVEIDMVSIAVQSGDRILLCSDGLSRSLACESLDDPIVDEGAGERILSEALQRDGSDNISFVLVAVPAAHLGDAR